MSNLFALVATDAVAYTVFIVKIVLAALMVLCAAFIIVVVMKQSGNSDGLEAMSGSRDEDDSYNMSTSQRKERRLKIWTFVCAGLLALCSITFVILTAVLG